jgi:hypothetical protein
MGRTILVNIDTADDIEDSDDHNDDYDDEDQPWLIIDNGGSGEEDIPINKG